MKRSAITVILVFMFVAVWGTTTAFSSLHNTNTQKPYKMFSQYDPEDEIYDDNETEFMSMDTPQILFAQAQPDNATDTGTEYYGDDEVPYDDVVDE